MVLGNRTSDFCFRIVEVPGQNSVLRADHDTRRFEADVNPVGTEMTFRRRIRFRIDIDRIIGTGLHTGLASDTDISVELHNPVLALIHRRNRTDPDARMICAVIAPGYLKIPSNVRLASGFDTFHPCALDAERNFVLALACGRAGMTTDTGVIIDQKTVIHQSLLGKGATVTRRDVGFVVSTLV